MSEREQIFFDHGIENSSLFWCLKRRITQEEREVSGSTYITFIYIYTYIYVYIYLFIYFFGSS